MRIIASIESALGVMNLKEIATADPRVDALVVITNPFSQPDFARAGEQAETCENGH